MKKIALLAILFSTSCATTKRVDLLKASENGYTINLNSKPINIKEIYLDRNNISNISKNRKLKIIDLTQKNVKSAFPYLSQITTIKGTEKTNIIPGEINVVVIDGEPIESENFNKVQIEVSSIKTINFVKIDSSYTFCRILDNIVLIQTNAH